MQEKIEIGYQAFVDGKAEEFGAVRHITPDGNEISVYIENAGEFMIPRTAVKSVQSQKVTFASDKLDARVRKAISHAHDAEDPAL